MFSFSYAKENISTTFHKIYSQDDGNYFPISNYWLSNGYIEFSKTIQYEKNGQTKMIRDNQYFIDMGNFAVFSKIPYTDEIMDYFINRIWGDKKFIELLLSQYDYRAQEVKQNSEKYSQNNVWVNNGIIEAWGFNQFIEKLSQSRIEFPKIKILWSDYRCRDFSKLYFENNNIPTQDTQYKPCMFEEKKEFSTNTQNSEVYSMYSEKNKNIKIKIFPVDQRKYIFDSYGEFESWTSVALFLVDPILDYYNLRVAFIDWNNKWNLSFSQDKIIKKYQIVQYNRVWKYWDTFLTYWIFPYYELELELASWVNKLKIDYLTYTVGDDYWYYISE